MQVWIATRSVKQHGLRWSAETAVGFSAMWQPQLLGMGEILTYAPTGPPWTPVLVVLFASVMAVLL